MPLILRQSHPSDPFFPATADPKAPYESKVILAGYFWSKKEHYYQHDKVVLGHTMDITLLPGDVISTGTPAGVGIFRTPPITLAAGNVVTCRIDTLGELVNPVVAPV